MVKPRPPDDVLATWPKPNFIDPQTRGDALLIVSLISTSVCMLTLLARTYVRVKLIRKIGVDDLFVWLSGLGVIGMCVSTISLTTVGWDRHQWDQRPEWTEKSEIFSWAIQLLYVYTMGTVKISVLTTFLRVCDRATHRILIWVVICIVSTWGIGSVLATIFTCRPVEMYWKSRTGAECTNENFRLYVTTVINILSDFLVVFMPLPVITRLKVPRAEKCILIILVFVGLFASAASVVRAITMAKFMDSYDITWHGYIIFLWTVVETNLSVTCLSLPFLRPLCRIPNFSRRGRHHRLERIQNLNYNMVMPWDDTSFTGGKQLVDLSTSTNSRHAKCDSLNPGAELSRLSTSSWDSAAAFSSVGTTAGLQQYNTPPVHRPFDTLNRPGTSNETGGGTAHHHSCSFTSISSSPPLDPPPPSPQLPTNHHLFVP